MNIAPVNPRDYMRTGADGSLSIDWVTLAHAISGVGRDHPNCQDNFELIPHLIRLGDWR